MVQLFREFPLLNTPSLVLVLLRGAEDGTATVAGATAAVRALLARAGEAPPVADAEIAGRLATLVDFLASAKLLAVAPDGSFETTERGRAALRDHPQGLDVADLMAWPEFARHVRGLDARRTGTDTRAGGYDQGFDAYWSGLRPADNPFAPDSADHLAWENGWSEALDEDFRWTGPRAGENLR